MNKEALSLQGGGVFFVLDKPGMGVLSCLLYTSGGNVFVAVQLSELTGQHLDVAALIALGGQGISLLAAVLLQVADSEACLLYTSISAAISAR